MRFVDEPHVAALELAVALDVDPVEAVDHHFGDGVVAEERLDRAVAENVVGQLADDLSALLPRQRSAIERELFRDGAIHLVGQVTRAVLLEELRPKLGDALVVDAALEIGVRIVGKDHRRLMRCAAVADDGERRRSVTLT